MTASPPAYLFTSDAAVRPIVILAILALIWTGAIRMRASSPSGYRTGAILSLIVIAWSVLTQRLGSANVYNAGPPGDVLRQLLLPLALLLPVGIAAIAIAGSRRVGELVSAMPLWGLVGIQVYRVAGVIFLLLWSESRLPWQFAMPAGIGDVLTGCCAIAIAARLVRGREVSPQAIYLWSLFGIGDLVLAVSMGELTSPGPAHLLAAHDPNLLISAYPLVMIPTFGVPLALILHGAVLWRVSRRSDAQPNRDLAPQAG